MAHDIKHPGVIVRVDGQGILVRLEEAEACAACRVKGGCMAADMREKIIGVPHPLEPFAVGERVNVAVRTAMGLRAVAYCYVLPLAVLLAVVLALTAAGASELCAGLGALAATAGYYIALFLMRSRLERQVVFTLEKI